jgi:zinc transporter 1/2/3
MFSNPCIGVLQYEATTSAIVMAGIFISFVVEYIGQRIVQNKIRSEAALSRKERAGAMLSSETVGILVMEMGIIFHSLLIGLTLVVAGDSFFITLFIVILFHQVFEGIALGTRIATVGTPEGAPIVHSHTPINPADPDADKNVTNGETSSTSSDSTHVGLSMKKKLILASLFAFITPIGMAIGIGVLNQFNGNDKSTLVAIGTLDAVSAGILVWVCVVEMWAGDWMFGSHGHKAELADADWLTTTLAFLGLITGMVLMSVLGMWA